MNFILTAFTSRPTPLLASNGASVFMSSLHEVHSKNTLWSGFKDIYDFTQ
jgi:hypothetical protein